MCNAPHCECPTVGDFLEGRFAYDLALVLEDTAQGLRDVWNSQYEGYVHPTMDEILEELERQRRPKLLKRKTITKVYVAGPIRAENDFEREGNIRRAEAVWLKCLQAGLAADCVHSCARACCGAVPEEVFLRSDFELIRRSDALVLVQGWQSSSGTLQEIEVAKENGVPIFDGIDALLDYINQADEAA